MRTIKVDDMNVKIFVEYTSAEVDRGNEIQVSKLSEDKMFLKLPVNSSIVNRISNICIYFNALKNWQSYTLKEFKALGINGVGDEMTTSISFGFCSLKEKASFKRNLLLSRV